MLNVECNIAIEGSGSSPADHLEQSDQSLSDPKKHFVCEVYFCQKKYIFDPERSTNCAKSSFSDKIIYKLPHFWPLIFVKYFINFTYNTRDYKVAGII